MMDADACNLAFNKDSEDHDTINKYNIGVGRIEFKHVEIDKKISEAIQRSNQSEKHEASTLKGRCSSL